MRLEQIASTDFVLVQADWTAAEALRVVDAIPAEAVVVHRREHEGEYFYLFKHSHARGMLAAAGGSRSVREALDLHEGTATATADANDLTDDLRDPFVVVVDDGKPVGFYVMPMEAAAVAPDDAGPVGEGVVSVDEPVTRGGDEPVPRGGGGNGDDFAAAGPTRGDDGDAAPSPVVRHLEAEFPDEVEWESTTSLLVSLLTEGGGGAHSLPVAVSEGATIDVVVQARRGLQLEGQTDGQFVVGGDEPLPLQFKVKAVTQGRGMLRVLAYQDGQALGAIMLTPLVTPKGEAARTAPTVHEAELEPVAAVRPDLMLLVMEDHRGDNPTYTLRLTARDANLGLHFKPFGPIELETSALKYFNEFFRDIEGLSLKTQADRLKARLKVEQKGAQLFEQLIPADLRALLWKIQDRIDTVSIESEEPYIPWELCRLVGEEDGRVVEGEFFAEKFACTRWLMGIGTSPRLTANRIGLVVPSGSNLPMADREAAFLTGLRTPDRTIERVPARYVDLLQAFKKGEHDVWHFTGHGIFRDPDPNLSYLALDAGEKMTAEDVSGTARNLGRAKPIVFLNACQVGRQAMSLADIGGWAAQFLRAGAGAFIGAYWSVYDDHAFAFAQKVYKGLLEEDKPIAQAIRDARLSLPKDGDPTWLAYTVYADPHARVG